MEPEEYTDMLTELPPGIAAAFLGALIAALFYALYAVASRHFVPALRRVATALRMPQDVAGVTLLALGNGAPDFCTAMLGARAAPEMIIAGAVGSGLFSVTVVLGAAILSSPASYTSDTERGVMELVKSPIGLPVDNVVQHAIIPEATAPLPSRNESIVAMLCARLPMIDRSAFIRSAAAYGAGIVALAVIAFVPRIPLPFALGMIVLYALHIAVAVRVFLRARNTSPIAESAVSFADECTAERRVRAFIALSQEGLVSQALFVANHGLWRPVYRRGWLHVALALVAAPIDAVFAATIPPVAHESDATPPKEHVARQVISRLRLIMAPFAWLCVTLILSHSLRQTFALCVATLAAGGASVAAWAGSSWQHQPAHIAAHASTAATLAACAVWVYHLSNEAVSCLQTLGAVVDMPETLIGLIVLAWGNTFGDLVADSAVARAGGVETAIVAAFAGPAQNVLLSLGITFAIGGVQGAMTTNRAVYAALIILATVTVCSVIAAPFLWRMRIPRAAGAALLVVYAAFVPLAVFLGLHAY